MMVMVFSLFIIIIICVTFQINFLHLVDVKIGLPKTIQGVLWKKGVSL